jgi:glycosyltransferase involved in cell wall biosynthesis
VKILIVNRFFGGAQIPTGRMAEDVGRLLAESGHEVTALASSGAYEGAAQARDTGEAGVAVGQCLPSAAPHAVSQTRLSDAVKTEIPADRTTATPGPRPTLRVEEVRVPKWMPRALAWLWFTWQARKRIPRMDWDVCVLMTDPPLLPLLARRAARLKDQKTKRPRDEGAKAAERLRDCGIAESARRVAMQPTDTGPQDATRRVAVWLMDLYPEALAASGRIAKSNPLYKWYFSRRQQSLAAADLLICLGDQQKTLLGKALTEKARTAVVPPWDDREEVVRADDRRLKNLALYAGNIGEAHAFVDLLRSVPFLPNEWKLRFAVRGAKSAALRTLVQESGVSDRVIVSGYVSADETATLLASARVHLITMSPGWEGIVVPSKLYGCIRTGRPVLFIGPENADTAREIRAHDWGAVLPPGVRGEEVAATILELAARPTRATQSENGAKKVAELIRGLATD